MSEQQQTAFVKVVIWTCQYNKFLMSKEKRFSPLPSEGPSTSKKLKYETSLTEDNKTQATLRSNFEELPFSSGINVPGEFSVEPMETEITNNNLKYCEAQCSCSIHIIAANENKKELEKQSNLDLKKISECACALLNDVGGVVRLQNVQFASATAKDLDNFKGKLVPKLLGLITPLPYGEFFDIKGSFEDQDLFLFVKTFSSNGQGRISFLKTHLYLKDDHAVTRAPRKEVFDQLTEKAKGSKEIKYHLKELPIIRRDEFIYGSKLKDFQESKRIQLKAATEAGVAGIRNLKDRIKSNISAFANTEGGHIFIGVKDDLNIEGINCRGEEKEITEEITRIIREMKWGSESGSFIPEKGHHWDFEYYKVQNSPDDGAQVIVISVAGLKGIGGVHTAEPESYKYVDNLADLATSLKKLTLEDMQREVCKKQDFQAKVPSHFRNNKSSCIASVKGSCEEIKNSYFKMERGCPLVPKGFSTEGIQIIEQVQKLCAGDIGIIVGAQSWQSLLGGKTEEGVVCDFLLISRRKGLFLYTVAKKGWDVSNYNFRTATLFKRKLVAEGGMFEKFFITGHVIPLDSSRNDARVFSTPEYPDTYSATEASSRAKYSSLLKALVIVVASYPSLLANRLGLEFLNLLTKPQFKILWEHGINSNESRELWIHGGAGTGKTCVAVAFMSDLKRKLKGVGKENILYLCENKGLRKYIEKFNVAKTVCRKTFMWSSFPNVKHVIADEAQNFRMEDGDWLANARGLVEKSQGYLWVFLDSNQKTHEFATGLPELKYQQPSFRLRHVIRNSVNIVKYSKQFLTYEDDGKSLEVKHNFEGEKVIRISYGNSKEACVRETLMRLAKEGYGEHDIAVLLSTQKHIDSFNVDGMSFDTEESNEGQRIVLTSIRKYSGLERPVIILVDPKAGQFQSTKGLVYLGVTRANVKLIIIERFYENSISKMANSKQDPNSASLRGYIHNLSPVKRSKHSRTEWYDFSLQTSPSKVRRIVGFNISRHSTLKEHAESKTAVLLSNTKENDSNNDVIFNQQSDVRVAPSFDIDFDYLPIGPSHSSSSVQPAVTITLSQLQTLKINQKVNVTASISLGNDKPKSVPVKATQKMTMVKEDCILEDQTGTANIHIWDDLIDKVKSGSTYEFYNLNVKNFQGRTHLTTTLTTTIKEAEKQLESLKGPLLLETPEKEVSVNMFKFINKLSVFIACQACKRKITEISHQKYIKCKSCGVRQRQAQCNRDASVQVKVEIEGKEVWLTAFTDTINELLSVSSEVTLSSDSDTIEELLMDLKDINFTYNANRNVITKVTSACIDDVIAQDNFLVA